MSIVALMSIFTGWHRTTFLDLDNVRAPERNGSSDVYVWFGTTLIDLDNVKAPEGNGSSDVYVWFGTTFIDLNMSLGSRCQQLPFSIVLKKKRMY
jgi:hypothetical protein